MNQSRPRPLEVKVWGEWACFTRPEMKVERVSYPVMTPSAARGILEAIFWKPEFAWQVREIWVLNPIRYFSILRNEVNSRQRETSARGWTKDGGGYFADEDRAQRHTLTLRDICYLIRADVVLKPHATDNEAAYRDQFRRRVQRGQCLHRPALGCREFACKFGPPDGTEKPISDSADLGLMLFDLDYFPSGRDANQPRFFQARLDAGILRIPEELYAEEVVPWSFNAYWSIPKGSICRLRCTRRPGFGGSSIWMVAGSVWVGCRSKIRIPGGAAKEA
jgi:CRISPR-associated protein Cas5d